MKYLVVVAHPDDEVLGAGATIYKLIKEGHSVDVCILVGNVTARALRPDDYALKKDIDACMNILGIRKTYMGDFPNIQLNNVPHIQLVQFIERAIIESETDIIITHHPSDTNNDHLHTSIACQEAIRLFQRRSNVKPLLELLYMEILSSTEWNVNAGLNKFEPNTYVEIGRDGISRKIEALKCYRDVMRNYPHPRSVEALEGLASYRGGQSGCYYAEAFQSVLRRVIFN